MQSRNELVLRKPLKVYDKMLILCLIIPRQFIRLDPTRVIYTLMPTHASLDREPNPGFAGKGGGELLPYIDYIGMCSLKGYVSV